MEDLSEDMLPGKPVSRKMRALLDKEKSAARKRVIERGIVHFRADSEFMEALLAAADRSKIAPGTLCRRVVWDYLHSLELASGVAEKTAKYSQDRDVVIEKLNEIQDLIELALARESSPPKSSRKTKKK